MTVVFVIAAGVLRAQEPHFRATVFVEPPVSSLSLTDVDDNDMQHLLQVMNETARLALQRGATERAEIIFRGILERDPGHEGANEGLATILLAREDVDEALDVLRKGIAQHPGSKKIARMLARTYQQLGDESSAQCWSARARPGEQLLSDANYQAALEDLRCGRPMSALDALCCITTSSSNTVWARDLAIGVAYGQLGLQAEASDYFTSVAEQAAGSALAEQAMTLRSQLDEGLLAREYLRGALKVARKYDTNPAIIPAANTFGVPLVATSSFGNLYQSEIDYDVIRDYNFDLTAGYTFLHTSNDTAHGFDLSDNAIYIAAVRRGLWRDRLVHAGFRLDYDRLLVGSDDFLQRMQASPSLTLRHSDWDSTSLLVQYTLYDFLGVLNADGTPFDQDSDNLAVGIARQHQLHNRKMTLYGGYYYDRMIAEGNNFDYNGHRLQVGFQWDLPWHRMQLIAECNAYFRRYENPHSIFAIERSDDECYGQIQLVYPLTDDWRLSAEWTFDRNDSNLATNDYRRSVVDCVIEYRFPHSYASR